MDDSYTFAVRCTSKILDETCVPLYENMILNHLGRYAQFIMGISEQDNVSFYCDMKMISYSWQGVLIALQSVGWGQQYQIRSLGSEIASNPDSDLSHSFNPIDHSKGEPVVCSFVDKEVNDARIDIMMSGRKSHVTFWRFKRCCRTNNDGKKPEMYFAILAVLKAGAGWSSIEVSSLAKRCENLIITDLGQS